MPEVSEMADVLAQAPNGRPCCATWRWPRTMASRPSLLTRGDRAVV